MWSLLIFLSSLLSHFTTVSSLADNVPTDVGLVVDTSGLQAHENKLSTSATTIIDPLASSHGLSHTRLQPPGIECLVTVADENRSCAEDGRGSRVPSESEGSIPTTSSEGNMGMIPRIHRQTGKYIPLATSKSYKSWKDLNPSFQFEYYDDAMSFDP